MRDSRQVGQSTAGRAMTAYYERMGRGEYTTDFPEIEKQPYDESDGA